jgi:predicted DNA-binding protein (MmcQ/YjbR family)
LSELAKLAAICAGLPEAERVDYPPHVQFRVRKRTFAYFLDDHHGDGIIGVTCKAPGSQPQALIDANPGGRFYLPSYLGPRGWVALRLDRDDVDWTEVADLVTESYIQIAPKTLAKRLTG